MAEILVDIDDTLSPWAQTVHEGCARYGLHDGSKPWSSWHMWEDYGCTQEEWGDVVSMLVIDGLYTDTEPYPYAVEAINRLRWEGHRIHMVTARGFAENGENIKRWTPIWLEKFGFGYDSLTFAKDKVAAQAELGVSFDYAVDDGLHNFVALSEAGIETYLVDHPHNRSIETPYRVTSVWEFAQIVLTKEAACPI